MEKAQVSMETLTSIVILFIFFVVSLGLLGEINANAYSLKEKASQWNECTRIARLTEEVFVQGSGTQVEAVFSLPFSVSTHAVYFGGDNGTVCDFTAMVLPASVSSGTIRFSNSNGLVVIQNA
jgi:hypothetical protein